MKNELILLSGADIPFAEGTATIHQPTLYEISLIGETCLFTGCELLKFSKNMLDLEDKHKLEYLSDFNVLMLILNDQNQSMAYNLDCTKQVLDLIFPYYHVNIRQNKILLQGEKGETCGEINEENFDVFKDIIVSMFCLNKTLANQEYNVQGELAKQIAEKLKNRQKKLAAEQSAKNQKVTIFSKYISILTVGEQKDMNSFMQYTVYQLFDEFQRYQLKASSDAYLQARLAGARDIEQPEDWMKDIHN